MLDSLHKFVQSLSVTAPDTESKPVRAHGSSLQELTLFMVDDSYIFNGFREQNRDV